MHKHAAHVMLLIMISLLFSSPCFAQADSSVLNNLETSAKYASKENSKWKAAIVDGKKHTNDYAQAERNFSLAVDNSRQFGNNDPRYVYCLTELAASYMEQKKYADAERSLRQALAGATKLLDANSSELQGLKLLLSMVTLEQGKTSDAGPMVQQSLAVLGIGLPIKDSIYNDMFANMPRDKNGQPDTAAVEKDADQPELKRNLEYAQSCLRSHSYDEASKLFAQCVEAADNLSPKYGGGQLMKKALLGSALFGEGAALTDLNQYASAQPLVKRAVEIMEELFKPEAAELVTAQRSLATIYWSLNRYSEAVPIYEHLIALEDQENSELSGANVDSDKAFLSFCQGNYAKAEEQFKSAIQYEGGSQPNKVALGNTLNGLYSTYLSEKKDTEAKETLNKLKQLWPTWVKSRNTGSADTTDQKLTANAELNQITIKHVSKDPGIIKVRQTYFEPVGVLYYEHAADSLLPLRDGTILALDGHLKLDQEKLLPAADGKQYGNATGIIEQFDPKTKQTKLLTQLPVVFATKTTPNTKHMNLIELKDGRIFIVGKFAQPGHEAAKDQTDIFGILVDIHTNTWEAIKATKDISPRDMVRMHLLSDGRVLILGGSTSPDEITSFRDTPETRVLVFNPDNKVLSVAGHLLHPRYGHQSLALDDNKFVLFGGYGPSESEAKQTPTFDTNDEGIINTQDVEVFDLKSGTSQLVGHTLGSRHNFDLLVLPSGNIFMVNGLHTDKRPDTAGAELYDLKTNKSFYVGEKIRPEQGRFALSSAPALSGNGVDSGAVIKDDSVLLTNGTRSYVYDWHQFTGPQPLNCPMEEIAKASGKRSPIKSSDGRIFIMGGTTYDGSSSSDGYQGYASAIDEFIYPPKPLEKIEKDSLIVAARRGDISLAERALNEGVSIAFVDDDFETALHYAVKYGNTNIVKLLLDCGANANAKAAYDSTPLLVAATFRRDDIIPLLLSHKADVNAKDDSGQTPLERAIRNYEDSDNSALPSVMLLVNNGADVNATGNSSLDNTPLEIAAGKGYLDVCKFLIDHGANVNTKNTQELAHTALQKAAEYGSLEICQLLMSHGAEIKSANAQASPFNLAIEWLHPELVKLFMEKGADPKQYCNTAGAVVQTRWFYHGSTSEKEIQILNLLLSGGWNPDQTDTLQRTTLGAAATANDLAAARLLLDHGAHVNKTGKEDNPLCLAIRGGNLEMVKLLVSHGADPNLAGNDNKTPLATAKSKNRDDIVQFLSAHGAKE